MTLLLHGVYLAKLVDNLVDKLDKTDNLGVEKLVTDNLDDCIKSVW